MLRAILKLVAVGAVIAVFGVADSIELYAIGGGAVLLLPFVIHAIGPRRTAPATAKTYQTLDVIPLPNPQPMPAAANHPTHAHDFDIEGKTTRAPLTNEEAYEMHARYAPSFDQQAAIARYEAQRGREQAETAVPRHDPPVFDQGRYAAALDYANAFESQLMKARRTAAYEVAAPRQRIARGSYTPQQYRAVDTRSDQLAMSPSDWDARTLIGVHPIKPGK